MEATTGPAAVWGGIPLCVWAEKGGGGGQVGSRGTYGWAGGGAGASAADVAAPAGAGAGFGAERTGSGAAGAAGAATGLRGAGAGGAAAAATGLGAAGAAEADGAVGAGGAGAAGEAEAGAGAELRSPEASSPGAEARCFCSSCSSASESANACSSSARSCASHQPAAGRSALDRIQMPLKLQVHSRLNPSPPNDRRLLGYTNPHSHEPGFQPRVRNNLFYLWCSLILA